MSIEVFKKRLEAGIGKGRGALGKNGSDEAPATSLCHRPGGRPLPAGRGGAERKAVLNAVFRRVSSTSTPWAAATAR